MRNKRKSFNTVTIASTRADVAVNRIYRRVQIDGKTTGSPWTEAAFTPSDTEVCQQRTDQRLWILRMQLHHRCLSGIWYLPCSRHAVAVELRLDRPTRATVPSLDRRLHLQHLFKDAQHLGFFSRNTPEEEVPSSLRSWTGCCTKSKAKLALKPDSKPVFLKARPVPYAAMPRISTEIDRLVSIHVLEPVDHSEWAAPIVVVEKKNGSIRLCAYYSTGLNDALEQTQHPLSTPEDTFTKFNGGRYFSQLDLAEAYLQLEVDDVSKQLLTINTHRGLYHFNRLPFGVKPAPGIFQQCMDALIAGLDGTAAYLGDILVTGKTIGENNARLEAVLKRIQEYGFRVRLDKWAFLQTKLTYLGFAINAQRRLLKRSKKNFHNSSVWIEFNYKNLLL
ncbi:hypothetical protein RB195_004457 [Necator americanus]|uniref:Reverse transcriptase domain-containing protein n=1 Tax=Necator americanus TaxID=51031 RepID=A0ABR1BMM0_NECAM